MKWYLFILPYLLCFALITWGASKVQFIFGNEPIWLHHSKKMKLWKLPQNRRFSFEVWSSLPLAQLYGWKEDNICQSMHGKVSIYCPSGKWSVDSPLSTPNTTCKKYPLPLPPHKAKSEAPSLHDTTSHWLHGNSIPKIGCHYFWPRRIAFPMEGDKFPFYTNILNPIVDFWSL